MAKKQEYPLAEYIGFPLIFISGLVLAVAIGHDILSEDRTGSGAFEAVLWPVVFGTCIGVSLSCSDYPAVEGRP